MLLAAAVAGLVLLWQSDTGSGSAGFPTGTFADANGVVLVEFAGDGTGVWFSEAEGWEVPITYAVNGDLFTEMTFDYPGGAQTPATYTWTYVDGELAFELWGEDLRPHRNEVYTGGPYLLVE
jgi:hypothetical protein